MEITVKLYGDLSIEGEQERPLSLADGLTVGELLREILDLVPEEEHNLFINVNRTPTKRLDGLDTRLCDGDHVAILESGGSMHSE